MSHISPQQVTAVFRALSEHHATQGRYLQASQLVEVLALGFAISLSGVDVIHWLDQPQCRKNSEALIHWIASELQKLNVQPTETGEVSILVFDLLVKRLEKKLNSRHASLCR